MATNRNITDLQTLSKTSVDSNHYLETYNSSTRVPNRLSVASLFPTFSTSGSSSEDLYVSVTNKNQLNFKGIKSGDTDLLTVTTAANNIVLTALEAGIDLSLCNNVTSGFLSSMDFTGLVTGECGVSNGGTGLSTIAKGAMLYASADDVISATSAMSTNGQLLIGNATNGFPSVATLTAGSNMTITNGAGTITLAASLSTMAADLDMANYDIDLGTGWLSGNGTHEGINIDSDGKVFVGEDTPTAFFDAALNIKGSLSFANDSAPTIKPVASTSSNVGQPLTIEAGSSDSGSAGNLTLKAGTSGSGGGNGGDVLIYGGSEAGGTAGSIKNYIYNGSGGAVEALSVAGSSAEPNVTVGKGNLVITESLKGIIHTGSLTATQATDHTTGVTINATSGIITLAAVALNAATNAEFTFTNSTIQTDSVILLTMQDANTTNNAQLTCALVSIGSGSCVISVHNPAATGATSATASKIHFLVINNS
tara:strand:- start:1111 stop:2550 length:1440 start_codon:yes stop_codon:yes gene_type:complete